eukprot:2157415-Rhodomonas_salina.3
MAYEDYVQMAQHDVERRATGTGTGTAIPWRAGPEVRYEDPAVGGAQPYYSGGQAQYGGSSTGVGYSVSSGYQVREPYRQYQAQPSGSPYLEAREAPPARAPARAPEPERERGLFDGFPGLTLGGGGGPREPGQKEEDCVVQ